MDSEVWPIHRVEEFHEALFSLAIENGYMISYEGPLAEDLGAYGPRQVRGANRSCHWLVKPAERRANDADLLWIAVIELSWDKSLTAADADAGNHWALTFRGLDAALVLHMQFREINNGKEGAQVAGPLEAKAFVSALRKQLQAVDSDARLTRISD